MTTIDEARRQAALVAEAKRLGVEPFQLEMARAVGTDVVRDIVKDLRRGPAQRSSSMAEEPGAASTPRQGAVAVAQPLRSPPGINLLDALVEHQDRLDRAERAERLARADRAKKMLAKAKPGGEA
jgi:hypothetical protein